MMKQLHIVILLASVLLMIVCGCRRYADHSRGRQLLEEARASYMVSDYVEAITPLHEYIDGRRNGSIPPDTITDAEVYKFLGNIHFIYGDHLGAISNYDKALENAVLLADKTELIKLLYNKVLVYCVIGEKSRAKRAIAEIGRTDSFSSDEREYFVLMSNAYYERMFGNSGKAEDMMRQAISLVEDKGLEHYLILTPWQELAEYFTEKGEYQAAIEAVDSFHAAVSKDKESQRMLVNSARLYMQVYSQTGQTDKAQYWQARYMHLSDSLLNQNRFNKARELFDRHSAQKSKESMAKLSVTLTVQKIVISLAVIVVVGLVSLFIYRRFFRRKKVPEDVSADEAMNFPLNLPPSVCGPDAEPKYAQLYGKICSEFDENKYFRDQDFTIEKLAALLHTNVKYVSRAVHECASTNFRTFLNDRRIAEAIDILKEESQTIAIQELAARVGFASQSAFISAFKRVTSTTPSKYQRALNKAV